MSEEMQAALDEGQEIDPQANEETQALEGQETGEAESATAEEGQNGDYIPPEETTDKVQARINKLTAEKFAERRQREELERQLEALENNGQTPQPTQQQVEPTLEQFDYDQDAYTRALVAYQVKQEAQAIQQDQQKQVAERQARERQSKFDKKVNEYAAKNPAYFEAIENLPILPQATLDTIMGSEKGPQLVHYLGTHLDQADEIASLDPYSAAMRLGEISGKLSAPRQNIKQPSAAPDPIDPVTTGGSRVDDSDPRLAGATFE